MFLLPEQHGKWHNQHDEESDLRRQANLGETRVEEGSGHPSATSTGAPSSQYIPGEQRQQSVLNKQRTFYFTGGRKKYGYIFMYFQI